MNAAAATVMLYANLDQQARAAAERLAAREGTTPEAVVIREARAIIAPASSKLQAGGRPYSRAELEWAEKFLATRSPERRAALEAELARAGTGENAVEFVASVRRIGSGRALPAMVA